MPFPSVALLQLLLQKADYPVGNAVLDLRLAQSALRAHIQDEQQLSSLMPHLPHIRDPVIYPLIGLNLDLEPGHIHAPNADPELLSQELRERAAQPEQGIMSPNISIAIDDQIDLVSLQPPGGDLCPLARGSSLLQHRPGISYEIGNGLFGRAGISAQPKACL